MGSPRYRWMIVAAGGWIYDSFASYPWLYLGSWGLGLGAFLIALTFRPFPRPGMAPAPA